MPVLTKIATRHADLGVRCGLDGALASLGLPLTAAGPVPDQPRPSSAPKAPITREAPARRARLIAATRSLVRRTPESVNPSGRSAAVTQGPSLGVPDRRLGKQSKSRDPRQYRSEASPREPGAPTRQPRWGGLRVCRADDLGRQATEPSRRLANVTDHRCDKKSVARLANVRAPSETRTTGQFDSREPFAAPPQLK